MMYRNHIVLNKWSRNVSPNITAAPFCDQLTAQQEGVLGCPFISVTLLLQQTGEIYTMVLFLRMLD